MLESSGNCMYIQVQIGKGEAVPLHAMKGDWQCSSNQNDMEENSQPHAPASLLLVQPSPLHTCTIRFNIQKLYILPTHCTVFTLCMVLTINRAYFHIQN